MWELLNAPPNWAFSAALAMMLLLGILELLSLVLGNFSGWLDGLLPESFDADLTDHPAGEAGFLSHFFSWLYVGRVPVLMLLICFLTLFGGIGLSLQSLIQQYLGFFLPALAAIPSSFF